MQNSNFAIAAMQCDTPSASLQIIIIIIITRKPQ